MRFTDRVVVVTGGGSGIGRAMAEAFASEGARVVATDLREDTAHETVRSLSGGPHLALGGDVSDAAAVERGFEEVEKRYGRVDVLVNNAGLGDPMPAETEPLEVWHRILEVNLTAVFHLSQLCGRQMIEQGSGRVVNVASVLGLVASGQIPQASYTATKGAVVQLTRELAVQWARKGVRVNAIAPGWFQSEMTQEMFDDESGRTFIRRNTPMGRPGELNELDGALLYLASDASSYTTGAILAVDGGWVAR